MSLLLTLIEFGFGSGASIAKFEQVKSHFAPRDTMIKVNYKNVRIIKSGRTYVFMVNLEYTKSVNLNRCFIIFPASIYLFKVNNRNTRKRCEMCSKLTRKTLEYVSDIVVMFLLLTLYIFHTFF